MFNNRFWVLLGIIGLAVASRLSGLNPPNFAPIAAIALFGGVYFTDKRLAFAVTFAAMLVSDMVLGFHWVMPFVYLAFGLIVGLGIVLRKYINPMSMLGGALAGSVMFFLLTNMGVWMMFDYYPAGVEGLLASYTAGIPFFKYTVAGDLFYTTVLFGSFEVAKRFSPSLKLQPIAETVR